MDAFGKGNTGSTNLTCLETYVLDVGGWKQR